MHSIHCNQCFRPLACERATECPLITCSNNECVFVMHACKLNDHKLICENQKISCLNRLFGCKEVLKRKHLWRHLSKCAASLVTCSFQWNRTREVNARDTKHVTERDLQESLLARDLKTIEDVKDGATLSLDVNCAQYFTRAPENTCSFRCGHVLRRDEFHAHYENTHRDLIGQFEWVEPRCPLSCYGCEFKVARWRPREGILVFNQSFGLKAKEFEFKSDSKRVTLNEMPFEILENIFCFLDSFSLNQLSVASKRLRLCCETFLHSRGMVSLQWRRSEDKKWKIDKKVWFFSNSFTKINWNLNPFVSHAIANHLNCCEFNLREDLARKQPFLLPKVPPNSKFQTMNENTNTN